MKIYTKEVADKLVKSLESIEIKQTEKDYVIKNIVMSSATIDRHGEIILQEGIDITEFNKNPVALIDHNYSVKSIAGIWSNIRKEAGKTLGDVRLVDTEAGRLIKVLHEAGAIKDVSIGFIVKERDGDIIKSLELLECSFVVIGANREAKLKEFSPGIIKSLKEIGIIEKEEKKENEELSEIKILLKSLTQEVVEIKKLLVDGKTISEADKEKKENLQTAVRAINDVLRDMKQK